MTDLEGHAVTDAADAVDDALTPTAPTPTTLPVCEGDTWETLADRAGVDVLDLLSANVDLGRPSSRPPLVVGQSLALP